MPACPKPRPRIHDRAARLLARQALANAARAAIWRRDGSRCRVCGKHVKKGAVDSVEAGHMHHLTYRSQGGTDKDWEGLVLLCCWCHSAVHNHTLTLSGRASALTVERS